MNWVDLLVLIIFSSAIFSSLRAGFLRQALSLLGFIVGIYAAVSYHQTLAQTIRESINDPTLATVLAFVVILIGIWLLFSLLAVASRAALKTYGLTWIDNLFGALIGIAVGAFVTVCLLLLFVRIPFLGVSDAIRASRLAALIFQILPALQQLLPSELRLLRTN